MHDLGERLIGGQRAGASGQAQHGVRLCFDQVSHTTAIDLTGLSLIPNNNDLRHAHILSSVASPSATTRHNQTHLIFTSRLSSTVTARLKRPTRPATTSGTDNGMPLKTAGLPPT